MSNQQGFRSLSFFEGNIIDSNLYLQQCPIKGIEVMRALRKGQASSFYYGQPQGEVCLINRVFGL
ncbi:hypothetical protein [Acinetobacter baumannii]